MPGSDESTNLSQQTALADRAINHWHYTFDPAEDGTNVTESFRMNDTAVTRVYCPFAGYLRKRRNLRDMRTTLERIRDVVEIPR